MAVSAGRKSVMTIYSDRNCPYSHRARLVLSEKNISADVELLDEHHLPEDLLDLNPYNSLPTLIDRDLVLYESRIIMEYLDERFPHPPLMPIDPVSRAQFRLFLYRIERDWYTLVPALTGDDAVAASRARSELRDGLIAVSPIFEQKPFFMSDEFSLVDCSLVALLWRLPQYGVELPSQAKAIKAYAERMFAREGFKASLTDDERAIRES